jgi:hypothetical protein
MRDATLRAVSEPRDEPRERPDATRWALIVALLCLLGVQALVVFTGQRDIAAMIAAMKEETAARNAHTTWILDDYRRMQFDFRSRFDRQDEAAERQRKASDERFEKLISELRALEK